MIVRIIYATNADGVRCALHAVDETFDVEAWLHSRGDAARVLRATLSVEELQVKGRTES